MRVTLGRLVRPAIVALCAQGLLAPAAFALTIELAPTASLSANSAALGAFTRAAARWSALLGDPISVRIDADFSAIGSSSVIGQASSVMLAGAYHEIRDAMVADAANEAGDAIVGSLPTLSQLAVRAPAGVSGLADGLYATKANLKALAFTGLDQAFGASDGAITFNSAFAFDFDASDGITAGRMDFETVAVHEIGHVLGFTSVVDLLDSGYNGLVMLSTLDLFRFAPADAPADAAQFATAPRLAAPGGVAVFTDTALLGFFATGVNQGDGRQASHWKDGFVPPLGVMDPTLAFGEQSAITALDLRALDLIGWEVETTPVPLPASAVLLAGGLLMLRRRRRAGDPGR